MLITCPACAARYAVDAALVPATGRTLRCSACGTEWTFKPAAAEARLAPGAAGAPAAPAPAPAPAHDAATGYPPPPGMIRSLDAPEAARRDGGAFLAGFAAVTLLALAAVAVHAERAAIAAAAPWLAGPLDAYAEAVERLRSALGWLTGAGRD